MCDALAIVGGIVLLLLIGTVALMLAFLARELLISARFLYRIYRTYGTAVISNPFKFVWYDAWEPAPWLVLYTDSSRTATGDRVYRRGPAYQTHEPEEEGAR